MPGWAVFFAICFCVASCLSSTEVPATPDCRRKFRPACDRASSPEILFWAVRAFLLSVKVLLVAVSVALDEGPEILQAFP